MFMAVTNIPDWLSLVVSLLKLRMNLRQKHFELNWNETKMQAKIHVTQTIFEGLMSSSFLKDGTRYTGILLPISYTDQLV